MPEKVYNSTSRPNHKERGIKYRGRFNAEVGLRRPCKTYVVNRCRKNKIFQLLDQLASCLCLKSVCCRWWSMPEQAVTLLQEWRQFLDLPTTDLKTIDTAKRLCSPLSIRPEICSPLVSRELGPCRNSGHWQHSFAPVRENSKTVPQYLLRYILLTQHLWLHC